MSINYVSGTRGDPLQSNNTSIAVTLASRPEAVVAYH